MRTNQEKSLKDAEVPEGGQDPEFVRKAFAKIADRYVLTNHVLSGGIDILWRKRVGNMVRKWAPNRILDVASGTGDLALELQRSCPEAEVLATDFCSEMLAYAGQRGVRHTKVADAMDLPFEEACFDLVTVAFGLRNMADWEGGLREMKRVLRPGGRLLVLDFSLPTGVLRRPYGWYLHRVLPKIAGAITGEGEAYEYLAGSIDQFPGGQKMLKLWEECGFEERTWLPLSGGIAAIYTGRV